MIHYILHGHILSALGTLQIVKLIAKFQKESVAEVTALKDPLQAVPDFPISGGNFWRRKEFLQRDILYGVLVLGIEYRENL